MKIAINVVLVLIVLFVACTGIALAEEEKANPTLEEKMAELLEYYNAQEEAKKQVQFTSGEDVKDLDALNNRPNVIEARGKMPIADTEQKREVLFEKYYQIGENTRSEIVDKYFYPDGPSDFKRF